MASLNTRRVRYRHSSVASHQSIALPCTFSVLVNLKPVDLILWICSLLDIPSRNRLLASCKALRSLRSMKSGWCSELDSARCGGPLTDAVLLGHHLSGMRPTRLMLQEGGEETVYPQMITPAALDGWLAAGAGRHLKSVDLRGFGLLGALETPSAAMLIAQRCPLLTTLRATWIQQSEDCSFMTALFVALAKSGAPLSTLDLACRNHSYFDGFNTSGFVDLKTPIWKDLQDNTDIKVPSGDADADDFKEELKMPKGDANADDYKEEHKVPSGGEADAEADADDEADASTSTSRDARCLRIVGRSLRSLEIKDVCIGERTFALLCSAMPQMEHFSFGAKGMSPDCLGHVGRLHSLQALEISMMPLLNSAHVHNMSRGIPRLAALRLTNCDVNDQLLEAVAQCAWATSLTAVDFDAIGPDEWSCSPECTDAGFTKALSALCGLRAFRLCGTRATLTCEFLQVFARSHRASLRCLSLVRNQGLSAFALHCLCLLPALEQLALVTGGLPKKALKQQIPKLLTNANLIFLALRATKEEFNDDHLSQQSYQHNTTLRCLDLTGCQGIYDFTAIVRQFPQLEALHVQRTGIVAQRIDQAMLDCGADASMTRPLRHLRRLSMGAVPVEEARHTRRIARRLRRRGISVTVSDWSYFKRTVGLPVYKLILYGDGSIERNEMQRHGR